MTKFQGRHLIAILLGALLFFCLPSSAQTKPYSIYSLPLTGAIGPATQDYLQRGIEEAVRSKADSVLIVLDTPGGLEKSMRGIVSDIIQSPLPIITYVSPSGARAASAGTFIVYASHVAAMAPGTNIGAATPVALTGSISKNGEGISSAEQKAINDASAYIKSLAQLRNRNVAWAEQAVRKGVSLSATDALQLNVIDIVADDTPQLLSKINGRLITIKNHQVKLDTTHYKITTVSPDWRTRFLAIITDPNIAYILLLIGIYGLIFEFLNPGFILPGVVGLISLLIALYAFQLLPINYVGLGLLLLGIAFMIAEAFVPSFGALGIGGFIAFIVGSIMLFDRQVPGFTLLLPVIIAVALVTAGLLFLIVQLAIRSHRKPVVTGKEELLGSTGTVVILKGDEERPRARIRGELWQIKSTVPLKDGQQIKVVSIDELMLTVEPIINLEPKEGSST